MATKPRSCDELCIIINHRFNAPAAKKFKGHCHVDLNEEVLCSSIMHLHLLHFSFPLKVITRTIAGSSINTIYCWMPCQLS
ncbi:hypothetical protein HanIR_Chr09g0412611 [Helianthus annuus]|nr:hypothetical protein HanIR_Chr09g0412611 [Helianthus annuus]